MLPEDIIALINTRDRKLVHLSFNGNPVELQAGIQFLRSLPDTTPRMKIEWDVVEAPHIGIDVELTSYETL